MVVVKHEHQVVGKGVELVEERAEHGFERDLGRLDEVQGSGAHGRRDRLQCGDHVCPESRWIVVALVQRQPCSQALGPRSGCQPDSQERGLAEARRCGDERQPRVDATAQTIAEPWTRDGGAPPPGDVELGLNN